VNRPVPGEPDHTGDLRIVRFREPAAFQTRIEPWLLRAEVEHNLILSLVEGLSLGRSYGDAEPYFLLVGTSFRENSVSRSK